MTYKSFILKLYLCIITFIFSIFFLSAQNTSNLQEKISYNKIKPIYGNIMIVGTGAIPTNAKLAFVELAKGKDGKLIIIKTSKKKNKETDFWFDKIGEIITIEIGGNQKLSKDQKNAFRSATALWLEDDFSKYNFTKELKPLLNGILNRNGVIGGKGSSAENFATLLYRNQSTEKGLDLLPNSFIWTKGYTENYKKISNNYQGKVIWNVPSETAVLIHNNREVSVLGVGEVELKVPGNKEWKERVVKYKQKVKLPYTTDLLSWNRSALQRTKKYFPSKKTIVPHVSNGALIIIGGSGYPEGMWEKVINLSGGTEANFFCISQTSSSYGAKKLKALGCKNVVIHHTKTGTEGIDQGEDLKLLEDIKNADALYFGGGRTYKFMDAYLGTTAHNEMKNLLKRGGLILGTSAGAQIQGDFLVRGDPRTNKNIWLEGSDEGLSFLEGVIIDAHFRERGRELKLPYLLEKHPQMLGIGIDEATALFVQKSIAEVWGRNSVTFYDLSNSDNKDLPVEEIGSPVILKDGQKYNLELRKKIK